MYGEGADVELEEIAKKDKKFTIPELEEMMEDLKEATKQLEEGVRDTDILTMLSPAKRRDWQVKLREWNIEKT